MITSTASAQSRLDFLRNVQAVLEDGHLVSTYKYALISALADIAVETDADRDCALVVPIAACLSRLPGRLLAHALLTRLALPGRRSHRVMSAGGTLGLRTRNRARAGGLAARGRTLMPQAAAATQRLGARLRLAAEPQDPQTSASLAISGNRRAGKHFAGVAG